MILQKTLRRTALTKLFTLGLFCSERERERERERSRERERERERSRGRSRSEADARRDKEVEDEAREKKRLEKKAREKEAAYQERCASHILTIQHTFIVFWVPNVCM